MTSPEEFRDDPDLSLIEHLVELRTRLIRMLLAWVGVFIALLPFKNKVYELFARPVLNNLLDGQTMLAQDGIDIFLTPIKVCLFLSFVACIPWIVYQIWKFVEPALYHREKRLMLPIIISATALFYVGMLFAYLVILPIMFAFLGGIQLEGVAYMPDITKYMSLSLTMFFAFGVAFEVPVATVILIMLGTIDPDNLAKKRPYIILGAFVVGMFLTPPDAISQTLLAVPMIVLFEAGLYIGRRVKSADPDATPPATKEKP